VNYLEQNVQPVRKYQANLMLGPHGLYEDLNVDDTVERVMLAFEGNSSVLDIAQDLNISFECVVSYLEKFKQAGVASSTLGPHRN